MGQSLSLLASIGLGFLQPKTPAYFRISEPEPGRGAGPYQDWAYPCGPHQHQGPGRRPPPSGGFLLALTGQEQCAITLNTPAPRAPRSLNPREAKHASRKPEEGQGAHPLVGSGGMRGGQPASSQQLVFAQAFIRAHGPAGICPIFHTPEPTDVAQLQICSPGGSSLRLGVQDPVGSGASVVPSARNAMETNNSRGAGRQASLGGGPSQREHPPMPWEPGRWGTGEGPSPVRTPQGSSRGGSWSPRPAHCCPHGGAKVPRAPEHIWATTRLGGGFWYLIPVLC